MCQQIHLNRKGPGDAATSHRAKAVSFNKPPFLTKAPRSREGTFPVRAHIDYRKAARAILGNAERLSEHEGQFLGGLVFRAAPLSEKQARWLDLLLERHGLPEWSLQTEGGDHD